MIYLFSIQKSYIIYASRRLSRKDTTYLLGLGQVI